MVRIDQIVSYIATQLAGIAPMLAVVGSREVQRVAVNVAL
jgi:hypothetical protein